MLVGPSVCLRVCVIGRAGPGDPRSQPDVSRVPQYSSCLSVHPSVCVCVSQAEQDLANPAANLTSAASYDDVMRLIRSPATQDKDKIRLVMLYALRFENDVPRLRQLQDYLITVGVRARCVSGCLHVHACCAQVDDLDGNTSPPPHYQPIHDDQLSTRGWPSVITWIADAETDRVRLPTYPPLPPLPPSLMFLAPTSYGGSVCSSALPCSPAYPNLCL